MRRLLGYGAVLALSSVVWAGSASALNWVTVADPPNDEFGSAYRIYGMSYALDQGKLYYSIRTVFPESGHMGADSYAYTLIDPGDLWIRAGGNVYGLAFTTHANVVQQAYPGAWPTVTKGNLYSNAVFADGTLEQYEEWMSWRGITPTPSDGNLYDGQNSYPTLIRNYSQEISGQSGVQWVTVNGLPWTYEITGYMETSALGLDWGEAFDLFWAMECGNDGAMISGTMPIPEPATMLLIGAGIAALGLSRRRRATR
ncbi:MAG: PEP-CTERM sorting domain-containing protein [Planctomycetes bacterium]|nr:PEP-CTERM sorting domain-containing protein [Planctomycetota bacterium]